MNAPQETTKNQVLPVVVLATENTHKVEEMRAIFAALGWPVRLLGLNQLGGAFIQPRETGSTFEENAAIKATSYAQQTGHACLADDSGLEIDALGGRPGVISSHYCTDGREAGMSRAERDAANNQRVLTELQGVDDALRTARFVCVMAIATPGNEPSVLVRGTFDGRIGTPPRVPAGENGFGYDPLFLVAPAFKLTSAQLPREEKNRMSHRAAAAAAIVAATS